MATLKEQEETLERIKGPHYYNISLNGYGAETSYMRITKEAYDFWSKHVEEHGDSDAIQYILGAEDKKPNEVPDIEFEDMDGRDIPREAMFMHDPVGSEDEDRVGASWFEPVDEFDHTWGTTIDSDPRLYIEKVDGTDYGAKHLEDVVDGEALGDWLPAMEEKHTNEEADYYHDAYGEHSYGDKYPEKGEYICQVISSEKGCFFQTTLETDTLFDDKKLKWYIGEAPNGEDLIYGAEYDGEEIFNDGGDTNGKGYYVYFYKQEF